jgi:hypothetical protein
MGICHNSGVEKENKLANPTTNYGFVLPTSTDLVTDLPADFDVALQGVDTRLKALQPGTTLGDLAYSSATANTNTRLGIGSTAQILTVAGGVPTWATPAASGAYTLLSTTTLSGTSTTVSSISQSYTNLYILIAGAVANTTYFPRFNPNGSATTAIAYNGATGKLSVNSSNFQSNSDSAFAAATNNIVVINIYNYTSTSQLKHVFMQGSHNTTSNTAFDAWGAFNSTSAITSVTYTTVAGTPTFSAGTMYIYGVK